MAVLALILTLPLLLVSAALLAWSVRRGWLVVAALAAAIGLFSAWVTARAFLYRGY